MKNRIKELRGKRGLTQTELLDILKLNGCDIDIETLSEWESGQTESGVATLSKMADIFDVAIDYLVGKSKSVNEPALVKSLLNYAEKTGYATSAIGDGENAVEQRMEFQRDNYQHTVKALKNYRRNKLDVEEECVKIEEATDMPFDDFISRINRRGEDLYHVSSIAEKLDMRINEDENNTSIAIRAQRVNRSKSLINHITWALNQLKTDTDDGARLYYVLSLRYLMNEPLTADEITQELGIGKRRYFRLKEKAENRLGYWLWLVPGKDFDAFIEALRYLDNCAKRKRPQEKMT